MNSFIHNLRLKTGVALLRIHIIINHQAMELRYKTIGCPIMYSERNSELRFLHQFLYHFRNCTCTIHTKRFVFTRFLLQRFFFFGSVINDNAMIVKIEVNRSIPTVESNRSLYTAIRLRDERFKRVMSSLFTSEYAERWG